MTTQAHTSGPWDIVQDAPLNPRARFNIGSRGPGGPTTYVCTIKTEKHLVLDGNEEANARLIAAAPDLLRTLKNAREWLDELAGLLQDGALDAAEDWAGANAASVDSTLAEAIAKAEGAQ